VERLGRIEDKIDKLQEDSNDTKITLAINTRELETHIKRTNIAEENIRRLQEADKRVKWTMRVIISLAAIATFLKEMGII
jgi:hypothetical protein